MSSSPYNFDQWNEWAALAQKGDKAAYRALLRELSAYSRAILLKTLANTDWADDIVQEVLLSVHKALPTYRPDKAFKPWLLAIVGYRRTDYLRRYYRQHRHEQVSLESAEFLAAHVTNQGLIDEYIDIQDALAVLPKEQRRIWQKIKLQGYSAKEVAQELGMKESAVKVSAHRTHKKLKDKLGS